MSAIEDSGQHPDSLPRTRTGAVRVANDHIAARAEALHFISRVPLLCECDDPGCRALVLVSLDEFGRLRRTGEAVIAHEPGRFGRSA
jgi:hypothetical protein